MVMIRCSLRSVRTLARTSCVLASSLFVACPWQPAWAQVAPAAGSYTWDTIGAEFAALAAVNTQKGAKDQVIYGRSSFSTNRPLIDSWYKTYLFPSMATEEQLGEISEKREMLAKDLESIADATLHQYLTDLAYEETTRRATGNYHPFVRYNAMLIIGLNLNQIESRLVGGVRYPAVRLPKAFDFMLDELKKPDQTDAVRLAAMLGIERHVWLVRERPQDQPIPDGRRAEIAAYMQTLLDERTPPAGRGPAAHTWLRRIAACVLGGMGAVGDNRSVFESLVRIVGDAEEPMSLRYTAAETLGHLVYTDVAGIDALATARQLGALVAFACRAEEARAKDEQKKLEEDPALRTSGGMGVSGMLGGMMSGMSGMSGMRGRESGPPSTGDGMRGPGAMPGMPGSGGGYPGMGSGYPGMGSMDGPQATPESEDLVERTRRRLKLPLACVLMSRRGQGKSTPGTLAVLGQLAADDQQKAEITKIIGAVDAVVKATDETKGGLEGMLKQVRAKTLDLQSLLPNVVPESAKPAADEALPGGSPPGGDAAPATPGADAGPAKEAAKG